MNNIDYNKQLKEALSFIEDTPYIKEVLDGVVNIDKLDRNDIYELIYIEEKLGKLLDTNIENNDTYNAIHDLYVKIHYITLNISDDIINKAFNNKINRKRSKDISIKKYDESVRLKELTDKSRFDTKYVNPVQVYMKKSLFHFVVLTACFAWIVLRPMITTNNTDETVEVYEEISIEQSVETENEEGLDYDILSHANPDVKSIEETSEKATNLLKLVINLIVMLLFCITSARLMMDTIYLAFPAMRMLNENQKMYNGMSFVSRDAEEVVSMIDYMPFTVNYRNVDLLNKIEVSEVLLSNMRIYTEENKDKFNDTIRNNEYLSKLYINCDNLVCKLNDLNSRLSNTDKLTKLRTLAQSELIYDDFYFLIQALDSKYDYGEV